MILTPKQTNETLWGIAKGLTVVGVLVGILRVVGAL
jgi:hypothetical protein